MRYYNPSTDDFENRSIFFMLYYWAKKWWFFRRIEIAPFLVRFLGEGVMNELLQGSPYTAHEIFHGIN